VQHELSGSSACEPVQTLDPTRSFPVSYQSRQIADNAFEITADFQGSPVTFNVIVANDESEVPELVEHHLNYLNSPSPVYSETIAARPPDLQQVIQEQSAQIQALNDRLAALENA